MSIKHYTEALLENVPENYYVTPIGKAKLIQKGQDLSIITYGMGVHWAKKSVNENKLSADILDLRTLLPLIKMPFLKQLKKPIECSFCMKIR